MARVPYFDPAEATGRAAKAYARLAPLNVFAMLGHSGELVDGVTRLGHQILSHTALDPWLREVAILRTGAITGSDYEVYQHRRIAMALGAPAASIERVIAGEPTGLSPAEALVCRFTEAVVVHGRPDDALFEEALAEFGLRRLQELVITCGYYVMLSRFLMTFDVDIDGDPGEPPFRLPGMPSLS